MKPRQYTPDTTPEEIVARRAKYVLLYRGKVLECNTLIGLISAVLSIDPDVTDYYLENVNDH